MMNSMIICAVRECCDGFFASSIVPCLSSNIVSDFAWSNPIPLNKVCSYIASCVALDKATYSVLVDERATIDWCFDLHDTVDFPI